MKVIFIADVPNVARAGQTREVANGYARNFLFPHKLAVLASSQAAANVEAHLKKLAKQRAIEEAEMSELAKKINGVELTLKAKIGEKEKLYGSVTNNDIAAALSKEIGREIDKKRVELAEPIRLVGVYDVTIKFTHDIIAVVTVTVMSDAEGAERPVRAEKAEAPVEEVKAEEPSVQGKPEKVEKKEKKAKKEKAPKEPKEEKPAAEEKAPKEPKEEKPAAEEKAKKPAKEKKVKVEKEVKPAEEEKPAKEAKKEKKPRSRAKKTEEAVEEKKE